MSVFKRAERPAELQPGFPIVVDNLSVALKNQPSTPLLHRGVSMQIEPGTYTAIVGASGSGKTTFLNVLRGVPNSHVRITEGTVRYGELDIYAKGVTESIRTALRGRHIGFVPQGNELVGTLTGRENIERPRRIRGLHETKEHREYVGELALALGMDAKLDVPTSQLSGGENRRIAILRGLANPAVTERPVLMVDEATSGLAPAQKDALEGALAGLAHSFDATVIAISHEHTQADHVYELVAGTITG